MIKVQRVSSLRSTVNAARKDKKTIGFVPTMGNLHQGHLELVRVAKSRCEFVVVSIFVNPTQFGKDEDLSAYPNTPEEDARLLAELDVDVLFLPEHDVMYPGPLDEQTQVFVPKIGDLYCGKDRPVHFYGVTTVVSRLFNMVNPDIAVFGKKDYQQLAIIRRMVTDLAFPVQIVGVDTVRDDAGLALSSRNGYLSKSEVKTGAALQATLKEMATKLTNANDDGALTAKRVTSIERSAKTKLRKSGFQPHYVSVCTQHNLTPPIFEQDRIVDGQLVILAAATLGKARLIDNLEVNLDVNSA